MSPAWTAFRAVLAVQVLLAGWAAAGAGGCGACRATGSWLALAGLAGYAATLATALARGPCPAVFGAAIFAAGVHAVLAAHLWTSGLGCGLCVAAAAGAALLAGLAVACDRTNLARGAAVLPWAVLAAVAAVGWPRSAAAAPPSGDGAAVRLTIFTQPDCPYCDRLRERVMPEIEREFGSRLRVDWRPAADLPALRRTPTLIVAPERRRSEGARVFEGLPAADELRAAIRKAEGLP